MISKLHYITQDLDKKSHPQLTEEACIAGVNWVQLRVKNKSFSEYLQIAKETVAICKKYGVVSIINDNPEITKLCGADGVHLGKEDVSPAEARKLLGDNAIIGGTANTLEDIQKLIKLKVNYIGFGPFRFTSTKEKLSPVIGLEGIRNILMSVKSKIPVIVIGGINPIDIKDVIAAGAYGVAVSSAINFADEKNLIVSNFYKNLEIKTEID